MRITTLAPYKGNTWQLETDTEEEPFFLHVSVIQKLSLQNGMELTEKEWETVQYAELARKAYQRACFLLDHRGYSYQEMYRKLEPNYPMQVCITVLDKLAALGQINDRAYAEQLAHHYMEIKQYGLRRAYDEMRRRGLLEEHIQEALAPYENRTEEMLQELIEKRYYEKYFYDPEDRKMIEKGKAALARRGYRYPEIRDAVREVMERHERER